MRRWFQYPIEIILTANQQGTKEIHVSSEHNFICQKFVHTRTGAYKVRMVDANEIWQNDYVDGDNLCGTAQQPNILLNPIIVPKNATVLFQFIDISGAGNTIRITMEGYLED
jgi:hypothetical protein